MKAQLEQNMILMSPHSLINFKIRKHYQNEPKFNGVYSRNNLSKTKDGVYIKRLGSIGTHWIPLYENKKKCNKLWYFTDRTYSKRNKKSSLERKILQRRFIEYIIRIFIRIFIRFSNVWIFLYWIYWFHVKR